MNGTAPASRRILTRVACSCAGLLIALCVRYVSKLFEERRGSAKDLGANLSEARKLDGPLQLSRGSYLPRAPNS